MATKIFYDHLTIREEVTLELDKYQISSVEKEEIIQLVDENIHHRVLDVIFTHLPKDKHEIFLKKFHHAPHDSQLLDFLKTEVSNIEELISDEAKKVKQEILNELKRAKRN